MLDVLRSEDFETDVIRDALLLIRALSWYVGVIVWIDVEVIEI